MDITKSISIYEAVTQLIGAIHPAGATHIDKQRQENLEEMCALVEMLISDIEDVSLNANRQEISMKKAGDYAATFLRELHEEAAPIAPQGHFK